MVLATRVACNKEGNGNSIKGNGNEGGGRAMATRAMATMWAMVMVMRLAGNKVGRGKGVMGNGNGDARVADKEEGKGSKAMALATSMAGEWTATAKKSVMAMVMRVAGVHQEQ